MKSADVFGAFGFSHTAATYFGQIQSHRGLPHRASADRLRRDKRGRRIPKLWGWHGVCSCGWTSKVTTTRSKALERAVDHAVPLNEQYIAVVNRLRGSRPVSSQRMGAIPW